LRWWRVRSWIPDEFDAGTVRARRVPAVAVDIDGELRLTEPEGGYPQRQVGTGADVAYFWREILGMFGGLYRKYIDEAKLMEHSETLRRVA